jgi:hypothetical protein
MRSHGQILYYKFSLERSPRPDSGTKGNVFMNGEFWVYDWLILEVVTVRVIIVAGVVRG